MNKITIIGWYGTETIGDRAILAGVIKVLYSAYQDIEIRLGSIIPFFTERTLEEDEAFFRSCSGHEDLNIKLFNSAKPKELDDSIKWCDSLCIGGGPLEDIPSMFMLEYAIKKARKLKKKTMAIGCGAGPLYKRIYQKSMVNIVNNTDVAIFRDERSLKEYLRLGGCKNDCIGTIDPAAFALQHYKQKRQSTKESKDIIVISVREFTSEYKMNRNINVDSINRKIYENIQLLKEKHGTDILLVPMHYFGIGDDDRYFMNNFCFKYKTEGINVQNKILDMESTMQLFSEARFCVGMRFHSVVFQTILNGKNMVWDYTDLNSGKIGAFISQVKGTEYYKNSYLNLQVDSDKELSFPNEPFKVDDEIINDYENQYVSLIKSKLIQ